MNKEIQKEIAYPIWHISARWNQDDYKNNGTGFSISFRRHFNPQYMKRYAEKWWKDYIQRKDKYNGKKLIDKNPELIKLNIEFLGNEVWFSTWFAHQSLNYFPTEKEAFESFDKWFRKKGYRYSGYGYREDTINNEIGCPMGADEKWRWKLCGCKICKRLKITIIKH